MAKDEDGPASVDAGLFRVACEFRHSDGTRPYLGGVLVQPHPKGGAVIVATDSHRLLTLFDPAARWIAATLVNITPVLLCALDRSLAENGETSTLSVDSNGVVRVPSLFVSDGSGLIEAIYPNWLALWHPVIGAPTSGVANFNAGYLATFETAANLLYKYGYASGAAIHVEAKGTSPAIIRFEGFDRAVGLLMPKAKVYDDEGHIPQFLTEILPPKDTIKRKQEDS